MSALIASWFFIVVLLLCCGSVDAKASDLKDTGLPSCMIGVQNGPLDTH
jgi:hypothetical protein